MHCSVCGAANAEGAEACVRCGVALNLNCAACDAALTPGARFCAQCGQRVSQPEANPQPGIRTDGSQDAASFLLGERSARRGELKNITVLFADITNSTGLIEGMSPDDSTHLLQPALKTMAQAVHDCGGVVSQLQGDGLMALFGAPVAIEDHAIRACRAALEMRDRALHIGEEGVQIHVGVHTGMVLLRSVNTDLFMEYDTAGWTVHMAARMGEMAQPGEIRITEATAEHVEGFATLKALDVAQIRGVKRGIASYLLTGLSNDRSRWDARRTRGLNRFVGREEEIRSLSKAITSARNGRGELVVIRGEAGFGKSRLIHEFERRAQASDLRVLYSAVRSDGADLAYLPVRSLLQTWLQDGAYKADQRATALEIELKNLGADISETLPALQSLLDIPVEDEGWQHLDAFQRRHRMTDALKDWVKALAKQSPVVLIVEDLHWIDQESEAVLHRLAETVQDLPVLLLVSCRPEYQWYGPKPSLVIELPHLGPQPSLSLIDDLLGNDPSLDELKQVLVERAGGTPLFLEELARRLVETGQLTGEPGDFRLVGNATDVEVPGSISAIVSARIDFQPPAAKSMLELAAVADGGPRSLLLRASELDETEARDALASLFDAHLLRESASSGSVQFSHDVVREVAYSLILRNKRKELHARLARAIEDEFGDRLEAHVDQLAIHYLKAEDWASAANYHLKACLRAVDRSANRQAIRFAKGGVFALSNLSQSEDVVKNTLDLRLIANNALITTGDMDEIIENLDSAEMLLEHPVGARRVASVNTHLAIARWLQGRHEASHQASTKALTIAKEIEHPALQMGACAALGMAHHATGRYDAAIRLHETLRSQLQGDARFVRAGWTVYPLVLVDTFLASAYAEQGQFDLARARIDEGVAFADEMNHPYSQATIRDFDGYHLLMTGNAKAAAAVFEDTLEICRKYELRNLHRSVSAKLAMAEIQLGKASEALARMEAAIDLRDHLRGGAYIWHWLYLARASAHLARSQPEEALQWVDRSIAMTREAGERPHLGQGLKLRGDILARLSNDQALDAEDSYRAAIAEAEACGMRPLLAETGASLSQLLARQGNEADAEAQLRDALTVFEALGLNDRVQSVKTQLRQLQASRIS